MLRRGSVANILKSFSKSEDKQDGGGGRRGSSSGEGSTPVGVGRFSSPLLLRRRSLGRAEHPLPMVDDSVSSAASSPASPASPLRRSTLMKSLERTLSKLSVGSVELAEPRVVDPVILANMGLLQLVIADKTLRQTLISTSLALTDPKLGFIEKVRFCSCVVEFKRETSPELKLAKGRKILSIFVECGSNFQCSGITEQTMCKLRKGMFEEFDALVLQFTEELAGVEILMANCRRILNQAPQPPRPDNST